MVELKGSRWRLAITASVFFVVASTALFVVSRGERSAYLLTFVSFPTSFGLYGYSFIAGDEPMMAENTYYLDQTVMFSGAGSRLTLYFTSIRPLYAFMASLFAPLTGVIGGLALVNYLSWALAAYVAWRYTLRVYEDEWAAAIAVVFVAFGLGFVIHLHDYSPHLMPFTMYYLGTLVVFESGVWRESRPWRTHLRIGTYLAVAALGYSTGLILAIAYVLVAVRRNNWWHVGAAATVGLSSQYVWSAALNVMNGITSGQWSWIAVQGIEQELMARSLATWASTLRHPMAMLRMLGDGLLQFGGIESPLLIAAALVSWLVQHRSREQRWFDLVFGGLPIAVALVYLHVVMTRGYMSYGMSLVLYSTLAGGLAMWLRAATAKRTLIVAAIAVLVLVQAGWSTSHLRGYVIPVKMFHGFGDVSWIARYIGQWQLPPAISLTGLETTPIMFGGRSTITEAGAVSAPAIPTPTYSWRFGLVSRATLVVYLTWLAAIWRGQSRWRAIAAGAVAIWVLPVFAAKVSPLQPASVYSTFDSERIRAGDRWYYSIDVGTPFLEAARQASADADHVELMLAGLQPPFTARVTSAGEEIAVATDGRMVLQSTWTVERMLGILERSRRLEVELSSDHDTRVFGWQRSQLPGRRLVAAQSNLAMITALPAFEVRLLNSRGTPVLIGF